MKRATEAVRCDHGATALLAPRDLFRPDAAKMGALRQQLLGPPPSTDDDVESVLSWLFRPAGLEIHAASSLRAAIHRFVSTKHVEHVTNKSSSEGASDIIKEGSPLFHVLTMMTKVAATAVGFDALFPVNDPSLSLNAETVSWTKAQCCCILCCSFLCLFPRVSDNCRTVSGAGEAFNLPSVNYDEMFFSRPESVETEKLLMFFDYLDSMMGRISFSEGAATPVLENTSAPTLPRECSQNVTILRRACPPIEDLLSNHRDRRFSRCVVHDLGESIDDQSHMLRVDFANEMIGGASIAYGCVQEEITFSLCPELNTARLIHSPMRPNEAIVICGAEQFSLLRHGTYAFNMKHDGPVKAPCPRGGAVLAIDAMDYRYGSPDLQYQWATMRREMEKCIAAMLIPLCDYGVPVEEAARIATGNWGCGVFGGDLELKFLLQWVACSVADKEMHYFPFDQEVVVQTMLQGKLADRIRDAMTIGDMLQFLKSYLPKRMSQDASGRRGRSRLANVWVYLTEYLSQEISS